MQGDHQRARSLPQLRNHLPERNGNRDLRHATRSQADLIMARDPAEFDVTIIGAGPAGLAAACAASSSGARVCVIDQTPWLGGQIWRGQQAHPSNPQACQWLDRFKRSGTAVLDRTCVIAFPRPGLLMAERDNQPLTIRWRRLILANGARELFLPFPGWTLPGIAGPGGLQSLAKHGWPIQGMRVSIAGSGPLLLAVAAGLKKMGARVTSISEQAPLPRLASFCASLLRHPSKLGQAFGLKLKLAGIPFRWGVWPTRAQGDDRVRSVTLTDGLHTWTEQCDLLACGFGLVPNVELALALGCELQEGFVKVDDRQRTSLSEVFCAGEPAGIGGADCALVEGQIAGFSAAANNAAAARLQAQRASSHHFRRALAKAFALRPELLALAESGTTLCRCEDVSFGQVRQYSSWREAKLHSRCGMGACQGRTCGAAAKHLFGWGMESVRPPVLPARVGSLVSTNSDSPTDSRSNPAPHITAEPAPTSTP
jgi:NADPH-dependent 2,4-dienoyl-CoA reductase/sulfur reductase-like enzyme